MRLNHAITYWMAVCVLTAGARAADVGEPAKNIVQKESRAEASWWFTRGLKEAATIEDIGARRRMILYTGHRFADAGDLAGATEAVALLSDMEAKNPESNLSAEVAWLTTTAKVEDFGRRGKLTEALEVVASVPEKERQQSLKITLTMALQRGQQAKALAEFAQKDGMTDQDVTRCVMGLLDIARRKVDRKLGETAIGLLPKGADVQNVLANCALACMGMDGTIDAPGLVLLIQLMPAGAARGENAAQASRNLSKRGYLKEAEALAMLVPAEGRRAEAIRDLCKALGHADKGADAEELIAAEKDKQSAERGWVGLSIGLALRGKVDTSREAAKHVTAWGASDKAELAMANARGAIMHGDFATGTKELTASNDADLKRQAFGELVPALVAANRLDEAQQVARLFGESTFYELNEKGRLLWLTAAARKKAGDTAGVKAALKEISGLMKKVPEKNRLEATYRLAAVHGRLGDVAGGLQVVGGLATAADRDNGRTAVAMSCAEVGDFDGVAQALRQLEEKKLSEHDLGAIAKMAAQNGHVERLSEWIETWPTAAARAWGFTVVGGGARFRE